MNGRIFGIKKSYILTSLFVLLCVVFIALTLVTILVLKEYYLWFYIFCLCTGVYQIVRGMLFKFDSAFYLGTILLSVGGVGMFVTFSNFAYFQSVLYILCFASASYFTFVFFEQDFHLYLSILIFFACLMWFLVKIKLLSLPIFVAIVLASVLLFILIYTLTVKLGDKSKQKP